MPTSATASVFPAPRAEDRLRLLDRSDGAPGRSGLLDEVLRGAGLGTGRPRIRCPHCRWQPRRDSRWCCTQPFCGFHWNTFDTRGVCPACSYHWKVTQCLACGRLAPHDAWYEREDGEPPGAA